MSLDTTPKYMTKTLAYLISPNTPGNNDCDLLRNLSRAYGEINGTTLHVESRTIPYKPNYESCTLERRSACFAGAQ